MYLKLAKHAHVNNQTWGESGETKRELQEDTILHTTAQIISVTTHLRNQGP